ncbi:branched-chain amino acid transport system permease protein [Blastococcus colisei]|uniref:Branched-chain amino acid transport system permease protein n=1 Tax=Blastococcus colisei TaxID=1564162 RepID=A0A543PAC7_9ACTN|nr:branched-chain amino acid ABC transporter permease [Blastococcus colisei]TQN41032.1 branched-chain amino acid transport system permease protein [Blastococcus colisei]
MNRMGVRRLAPLIVLVVLALLPYSTLQVPGLFDGVLNSPGTLQLLALCLVFGGVALSFDLLFGFTGLLSFGHALYFAAGTYVANLALTELGWGLGAAIALTTVVGIALPLLIGSVALRVSGIAFSMVTLATAQVGSIIVLQDPGGLTGGEEGLAVDRNPIPDALIGVFNTVNKYWLALAYLVLVYVVVTWVTSSRAGRVWQAIRENERRVEVLGLRPYRFKLLVFVLAGLLATLGGIVHLLLLGGSTPRVTTADFTIGLLVMVVLGGAGSRWGAVLGGVLYTYLDSRLTDLAQSPAVQDLPAWLQIPLSEPLFLLGTLFVLVVLFVPGGIAGLVAQLRERRAGRRPSGDDGPAPGRVVEQLRDQVTAGTGVGAGARPHDGV